ncbi:MAG: LysR family transcriptional regulator [Telmatospirillum sp.]|nr:LysR family transcriptional regulator [Telmatospirillum sp.]
MNLRQLQHFVALADTCNVRQSSARLNLTQPALSKSIRTLEDDLGVVLFERLGRGLRLTPAGTWLLSRSASLLADVQRLRAEIDLIRRHADSVVSVAAGTVLCASLIPRSLIRLRAIAPGLRVRVDAGYWDDHRVMLLKGDIDLLVADARELEDVDLFDFTPLPAEPIRGFVRPGHPLARRQALRPSDLDGHAVAGLSRLPRELERLLARSPDVPARGSDMIVANDFSLLRAVTTSSDLVLFAPLSAVSDLCDCQALSVLDLDLPSALQTRFAIVWRRDRGLSPAADLLRQTILGCVLSAGQRTEGEAGVAVAVDAT